MENIEKIIFQDDIREKKKGGRGVFNRASRKRGIKGAVRFPSDYLSNKERKKLSGEVVTMELWEVDVKHVMDLQSVKNMDFYERQKYVQNLLYKYTGKELSKHWGISSSTLFDSKNGLLKKWEVKSPRARGGSYRKHNTSGLELHEFPTYDEIRNMDNELAKKWVTLIAANFSLKQITKHWDRSTATIRDTMYKKYLDYSSGTLEMPSEEEIEKIRLELTMGIENKQQDKQQVKQQVTITPDNVTTEVKPLPETKGIIQYEQTEKQAISESIKNILNSEIVENTLNKVSDFFTSIDKKGETEKEIDGMTYKYRNKNKDQLEQILTGLSYTLLDDQKYNVKIIVEEIEQC